VSSNKKLIERKNIRQVHAEGTIEDNGVGMLQLDFANKYIGGGVLRHVQNESFHPFSLSLSVFQSFCSDSTFVWFGLNRIESNRIESNRIRDVYKKR
jgi:hypothetical protein